MKQRIRRFTFSVFLTLCLSVTGLNAQEATQESCPLSDGVLNIVWVPKALDNAVFGLGPVSYTHLTLPTNREV